MASLNRIGFFWGEEKVTLVEWAKNAPARVFFSPLNTKANTASPFSSNLTEEIQITAILQKIIQDNQITGTSFYISLPIKEIILRSFTIPFVKQDDIQNAIKFEAKKYMPFDIQDLSFVYHTIPFMEDQNKRLQVIFFAARKEVLTRYERIFKQINAEVALCEPYMVSLAKALLFQKEIKPTDHLAFLVMDKNIGRICFIDQGIPQFIREFPIALSSQTEESSGSSESLNMKIVNEVGNSFDFYARQFNGERIEQMLVSSDFVQKDLMSDLEAELKVKITKYSPSLSTGTSAPVNDMDAIYAMGACVVPPLDTLSDFNFFGAKGAKKSHLKSELFAAWKSYQEIVYVFLGCVLLLAAVHFFYQDQLNVVQKKYEILSAKEGADLNTTLESIQGDVKQNTDMLTAYKNIRTKSEMSFIFLKIASHLPEGGMLNTLSVQYTDETINGPLVIDMRGDVYKEDANDEITVANQVYADFKNDKDLARFIKNVNLVSLNSEMLKDGPGTGFNIHCS